MGTKPNQCPRTTLKSKNGFLMIISRFQAATPIYVNTELHRNYWR